jgi:hypothetical protein
MGRGKRATAIRREKALQGKIARHRAVEPAGPDTAIAQSERRSTEARSLQYRWNMARRLQKTGPSGSPGPMQPSCLAAGAAPATGKFSFNRRILDQSGKCLAPLPLASRLAGCPPAEEEGAAALVDLAAHSRLPKRLPAPVWVKVERAPAGGSNGPFTRDSLGIFAPPSTCRAFRPLADRVPPPRGRLVPSMAP